MRVRHVASRRFIAAALSGAFVLQASGAVWSPAAAATGPAAKPPPAAVPLQRLAVTRVVPPAVDQRAFLRTLAQHAAPDAPGRPAVAAAALRPIMPADARRAPARPVATVAWPPALAQPGSEPPRGAGRTGPGRVSTGPGAVRSKAAMAPALVTASATTGINQWWTYQAENLPGVGQYAVNAGNGNLIVQADDMNVAHKGVALAFRRTYNSLSHHDYAGTDGAQPSNYGDGWTNSFDAHLALNPGVACPGGTVNGLTVFDTDGAQYDYKPDCAGGYIAPAGQFGQISVDRDGQGFQWMKKTGTVYDFFNPSQPAANAGLAGRLRRISGRNWNSYVAFTYTFDNADSSSASKLQSIDVAPEFAVGQSFGHAVLKFVDFYKTSCVPPRPCTKIYIHRLLSTLTWPDGTIVAYNYAVGANYASLALVSEPGDDASTGSCVSSLQTSCQNQTYMPTADNVRVGAVVSPRGYQTTQDGALIQFQYNGDGTLQSVVQSAVMNFTPNDGTGLALNNGAGTGRVTFHTTTLTRGSGQVTFNDSDGRQSVYAYDGAGRVTQVTRSVSGTATLSTTRGFDANNMLAFTTDARGNRTDYVNDARGNVVAIALPTVTNATTYRPTSYYSYDGNNNVVAACDPKWSQTHGGDWTTPPPPSDSLCPQQAGSTLLQWTPVPNVEPLGELTAVVRPLGYTRRFQYNAAAQGGTDFGQVTDVIGDQFGQSDGATFAEHSTYAYDAAGDVTQFSSGMGSWTFTYSAVNRELTATDPDNVTSYKHYNANGTMASTETAYQHATGTGTTYQHDVDGNAIGETHHFGGTAAVTNTFYDGADRTVEVAKPSDSRDLHTSYRWLTRYLYDVTQGGTVSLGANDPGGPLVTGIKAYGNLYKTQQYYQPLDANNNPLPLTFYDTMANSFDGVDREVSRYDLSGAFAASPITTNVYDEPGTLAGEQPRLGLLSSVVDGVGEKTLVHYDAAGRISEKEYQGSTSPTVTYLYDANGREASITQAGLGQETLKYDADGRLSFDTTPAVGPETSATTLTPSYYPNGMRNTLSVASVNAGLNVTNLYSYSYRNDGLMQTETVALGAGSTFRYGYSAAGRRTSMTDPATGGVKPSAVLRAPPAAPDVRLPAPAYERAATAQVMQRLGLEPRAEGTPALFVPISQVTAPATLNASRYVEGAAHGSRSSGGAAPPQRVLNASRAAGIVHAAGITQATSTAFQATTFTYDAYGRLSSETLPTGAQYANFTYDPENEVTSFTGYGSATTPQETVRNDYTTRGELVGRHFYANGGSAVDLNWPHFSAQPDFAVMLPTSENIQSGITLQTKAYEGNGLMYTSKEFNGPAIDANYIQGYGWQVDQAGRQTIARQSQVVSGGSYLGALQRGYDAQNHLTSWTVLAQDRGYLMNGWPVENQDVNVQCNAAPPTSPLNRYPPNTSIAYTWGPNGRVIGESVTNPGAPSSRAQLHWDGNAPLFTTDSSGHVDTVRVGTQAIVTPSGQAVMLDRDWTGAWVMTHSSGGFSAWDPPDPSLQNCKPKSPPPGSSGYNPPGLPLQFGQETSDTITDGYNFFAGVSNYDPQTAQWSAPDPLEGVVPNPDRQQPYMFNRNNPVNYADPSGFDSLLIFNPKALPVFGHLSVLVWDPTTNTGTYWSQGPSHDGTPIDDQQITKKSIQDVSSFIKSLDANGDDYMNYNASRAADERSNAYAQNRMNHNSPSAYSFLGNNCADFALSVRDAHSVGEGYVPVLIKKGWDLQRLLDPSIGHGQISPPPLVLDGGYYADDVTGWLIDQPTPVEMPPPMIDDGGALWT